MTIHDATGRSEFAAVGVGVRRVYELPAIPTLDWCARAAIALAPVIPKSVVRVWMVVATSAGIVIDAEDAGAADARTHDAEPTPMRIGSVGSRPSLGWWIPDDRRPLRARAARFADVGAPRPGDPVSDRWWRDCGVSPYLVGLAPIEPTHHGRHIAVEYGWASAAALDASELVAPLEAVLAELSRRAFVAFGPEPGGPANRVTDREQEVLELLALGYSVREIAQMLTRSPHTVHDHVKSLHRKLRVSNRGELIARAMGHSGQIPEPLAAGAVPARA